MRRISSLLWLMPALATGCGGGSGNTESQVGTHNTEPSPPKARYVELADAICKNHRSRREDLESQASDLMPLSSARKAREVAELLRKESDNRGEEVDELEALQPPAADVATVGSILSSVQTEARLLDRWAQAYDDLDADAIRRLQIRLGLTSARAAERARAYGFEVCGQE